MNVGAATPEGNLFSKVREMQQYFLQEFRCVVPKTLKS